MNGAQAHLLINHMPVLGTAFAAALLAVGVVGRSDELRKAGLWTFVLAALGGLAAFLTGEGAEHVVEGLPGVTEGVIHAHEEAAEKAFYALLALGVFALGGLLAAFRTGTLSRRACAIVLALAVPVLGLLGWTAHLGGLVRHTELRP